MMEDKIGGLYYVKVIFTHKSLLDLYCLYNIMRGSLMCEYILSFSSDIIYCYSSVVIVVSPKKNFLEGINTLFTRYALSTL